MTVIIFDSILVFHFSPCRNSYEILSGAFDTVCNFVLIWNDWNWMEHFCDNGRVKS